MRQNLLPDFQRRFAELTGELAETASHLPVLDAQSIAACASQGQGELAALREEISQAKVELPDGRMIAAWEHEALVQLARTNGVDEGRLLGGVEKLRDGRVVAGSWTGLGLTDISPLAWLSELETLWLLRNELTDISSLAGLSGLTYLHLSGNRLTDASPLSGLGKLRLLWLEGNQLSNVSSLAGLSGLTGLYLSHNQLTDISWLASVQCLQELGMANNPIDTAGRLLLAGLKSRGVRMYGGE